jgi:plastocyanin
MKRLLLAVALVVLAAGTLGGQASAGGGPAKSGKHVKASNFKSSAKKISISAGSKVTWTATEGSHTVTFKDGGLDAAIAANGDAKASRKFKKPGTYKYICRPHQSQGMVGKVVVH